LFCLCSIYETQREINKQLLPEATAKHCDASTLRRTEGIRFPTLFLPLIFAGRPRGHAPTDPFPDSVSVPDFAGRPREHAPMGSLRAFN
jgi:hypothetical protein